jgi:NhaP-type Na+/H+ or K+/H+ antiporter
MNPALWLVLILVGTSMLVFGVLAAVLGWLELIPALFMAAVGAAIETPAAIAFARSRRPPSSTARQ